QAVALDRRRLVGGEATRVARHHQQLGGEPPVVLVPGRSAAGEARRDRERHDQAREHGYCNLTFCSIEPPLSIVHSTIEPSYIRACLLPISSCETNQPIDAQ